MGLEFLCPSSEAEMASKAQQRTRKISRAGESGFRSTLDVRGSWGSMESIESYGGACYTRADDTG